MGDSQGLVGHLLQKIHASMKECRLLSLMQKMERKICGVNDCNGQHNYILHVEHGKATVNDFTVLDEEED